MTLEKAIRWAKIYKNMTKWDPVIITKYCFERRQWIYGYMHFIDWNLRDDTEWEDWHEYESWY